ncbi:MAG: hypothetical protein CSA42_00125 [Gammaproteobacteria bacterium]|nr:MAG: hypothetical protein CSA42_00125 [Gammaproteobacteria bacterium]
MDANKSYAHRYVGLLVFLSFFIFYLKDSTDYDKFDFRDTIVVGIFSLIFYVILKFLFLYKLKLLNNKIAFYGFVDISLAVFPLFILGLLKWWLSLILIVFITLLILIIKKNLIMRRISYFLLLSLSYLTFHMNENIHRLQLIGISKPTISEVLKSESRYFSYQEEQLYFYKISLPFSENTKNIIESQNCLVAIENEELSEHIKNVISLLKQDALGKKVMHVKNAKEILERNWHYNYYDMSALNFVLYDQKQIDVFYFFTYGI